jgi:Lrp/AsnC family leucine-responsive transcriptional regulator
MTEDLDKIDYLILKILQENSNITNLSLSKRIGLSPAPTLERVKKLEKNGIIKSYHAVVDPIALGLNVMTYILVNIGWHKENASENFLQRVDQIDEVVECTIITGDGDFLLKVLCHDLRAYQDLLFNELSQIPEVERLKTLMTLSTVKNKKVLPLSYKP